MDDIIELHGECVARWRAGVRGFGTRIFTHKDCAEHAANTCCCAYEREVTARKLRGARDALHDASAKMLLWQSRMAAAARLRHLRKRGYPAFRAWRNRSSGTAPQRKVLAMAVKVWSKRVAAKAMSRWKETTRSRRRAQNLLSLASASATRRWFTRWRTAAHAAARVKRIGDRVVRRLARATLAAAIDAWRARAREFISLRRRAVVAIDEATASVDGATDALIQRVLRTAPAFRDATTLVIAHRLDTIADSDCIAVFSAGELVECDAPAALL